MEDTYLLVPASVMYSPDKIKTCLLVLGVRPQFEYISEQSTLYLFNSDLACAAKTPQTAVARAANKFKPPPSKPSPRLSVVRGPANRK